MGVTADAAEDDEFPRQKRQKTKMSGMGVEVLRWKRIWRQGKSDDEAAGVGEVRCNDVVCSATFLQRSTMSKSTPSLYIKVK